MRHRVNKIHFKKKDLDHKTAMIRNLLTSLFTHKSLVTTEKRAKSLLQDVDRLVNTANSTDTMNAIRRVGAVLFTEESSKELFYHVAPKFRGQTSGFTRITPIKYRDGDSAKLVKIEFIK